MENKETPTRAKTVRQMTSPDNTRQRWLDDGKTEINNLLWELLPSIVTIAEAEELACVIFEKINDIWEGYAEMKLTEAGTMETDHA